MSDLPAQKTDARRFFEFGVFAVVIGLALALPSYGQMSAAEHASHHPGQAGGANPAGGTAAALNEGAKQAPQATPDGEDGAAPDASTGSAAGGMGGGMGDMMKNMGKAPPLELYPTLINLPEVTSEQRKEILGQADERIRSAVALLSNGLDRLSEAADRDDYAAMQEATAKMHEALAGFETGVAAKRILAEGQPPHQVALHWFKSEMSLQPPQGIQVSSGLWGASPFHLFAMALLIVFALAMIALYFVKMRRAAALFSRIEANKGAPPPGAAPALAGSPPPPAAPADKPAADAKGSST